MDGLRELAQAIQSYKKTHFEPEGKPHKGIWARLLLVCGLFEQVRSFCSLSIPILPHQIFVIPQAVAALYEIPELQIEAIHLAIALSYYGLLRVPSRTEASDVEIRAYPWSGPTTRKPDPLCQFRRHPYDHRL